MSPSKLLASIFVCGLCAAAAHADVKLASPFADNMVLQREMPVPVWGKADPGEEVSVEFAGQSKSAKADDDGKWSVKLDVLKASKEPSEMKVKGKNQIAVKNVLVGEVWVCSGQSNMQMNVKSSANADEEIANSSNPAIRGFFVNCDWSIKPEESLRGEWKEASPATVGGFSAAGYFFGRELNKKLDVPVGLIMTSWGGTPAEAWTPIENLEKDPDFAHYVAAYKRDSGIDKQKAQKEMAEVDRKRREVEAETAKRVEDPGNIGEKLGWQNADAYLADWTTVNVPTGWFDNLNIYGSIWYRKTVEVPAAWAGSDLTLELGTVDDFDIAYFNGVKVGSTGKEAGDWWLVKRSYKIPGNLVKAGKNVIAVRVFNDYLAGGFTGIAEGMKLSKSESEAIKLAGPWLRKVELAIKSFPSFPRFQNTPAFLYNAMIAPLIPYAMRGAIWYQGESNAGRAYEYRKLFPEMIKAWREKWGLGDFHFYFVQLANFMPAKPVAAESVKSTWAELREAQTMTLSLPNTGMAVIIDIGDEKDIHPKNKQDVGLRLAFNALAKAYGQKIEFSGPMYKSMSVEDGKARISFDHVGAGLEAKGGGKLKGFAICGEDKSFVWADAVIDGSSIVVSSPEVKAPVAVRYAWADNPDCNLYNKDGLPASPFRTDSFKGLTEK